ncbi:hypothetical protein F0562_029994 [Nyssa sinensis]|uniref:AAA+ ATPase domain-containing protein n=1 Tax=Nyssa sinensis TaxID=561372 RepID=A0A5J5B1I6_9ASTE|nr:hypothetical protein F0562_029994 [Nyssa sinensis]
MADIALATVIRKTADILANLAVEECTLFYWIKEDIRWIQTELEFVQSFLRDAEVNQGKSERMDTLLKEARDLAYEIEDIIDTYFAKIPTFRRKRLLRYLEFLSCIFCDWYTKNKFVMKIQAIMRRIENINRARTTYGITDGNDSRVGGEERDPRRSFPHVDQPNIVGFETHIEELEMLLQQNTRFCMISIVGLPGVGKTTLAKEVYNSVKANFNCRAWVYASQKPRVQYLLRDIARQVGVRKEEWENNADMEANLFEFLRQKRYLIVIDDIWSTKTWDALKIGIPNDCTNGSALIISSRHKRVGVYAGGDNSLYELQPLDDEKSWELFSKIVKLPSHSPNETSDYPELLKLGRQISRRCGGLPLTVVVTAGLLSSTEDRIEHRWKAVLNKMGDEEDQYLNILSLSYGDLPSHLKPCFLYFGLFPEDHLFPASELINLWIAEGFIKPRERQTLEDEAEGYLTELIRRNLIQIDMERYDRRIRSFRIHDCYAKPISDKLENLQLKVWDDGPYRVRESFFVEIPVFVEIPESSASTTSDSQNPRAPESPPLNFSGYQNLHNLYLEGPLVVVPEFTTRLTKLTLVGSVLVQDPMEELGKLPNLRKLQLRQGTYMGFKMVISGAGSFPLLEVLTIETMPLMKALKVEEGVMPKLRCVKINCNITLEIHSERLRNIFCKFNRSPHEYELFGVGC